MATTEWWRQAVIYQIYPKSFQDTNKDGIGDIAGITSHLPYIKKLGVDAIWLSPVYCSPQVDNGYDISDYRKIDPMFGTNQDMQVLIQKAHALGLKIIMDMVANHTSDQHRWFQESRKSRTNPYHDFYIWRDPKADGSAPNNWGSSFGGSAWTYEPACKQYYLHYYAAQQPDLNWENPSVRQAMYDIMRYWIAKGVDGWRLDVITSISKDQSFADRPNPAHSLFVSAGQNNGPRMHEFIHEMNREVLAPFHMMSVGEAPDSASDNVLSLVAPAREELNMVFPFAHMKADVKPGGHGHFDIQALDIIKLKQTMSAWQQVTLQGGGWSGLYFENHDRARIPSRWGNDTTYRYESATAFAALLYGMAGTPFVYQGEEIGMTNTDFTLNQYEDVETKGAYQKLVKDLHVMTEAQFQKAAGKVSRDHARTPMQWSSEANAGFSAGKPWFMVNPRYQQINVKADLTASRSVFHFYQQLIAWRHQEPLLINAPYHLLCPEDKQVFAYTRETAAKRVVVLSNLTSSKCNLPNDVQNAIQNGQLTLGNYPAGSHQLRPYETRIITVNIN